VPEHQLVDIPYIRQLDAASAALAGLQRHRLSGRVKAANHVMISISGLGPWVGLGSRIALAPRTGGPAIPAEIVALHPDQAEAMPAGSILGLGPGDQARLVTEAAALPVGPGWLGRVVDPLGRPLDGKGALPPGPKPCPLHAAAPPAGTRARLGARLDLGVRALDLFATCRQGQRLGLFAASGIGKSTLLAMLARGADCDVVVLGLVGERGRELREFVEEDLGPEGMARSVVVCATSDASPLLRRDAAFAAMAVAEHFADQGQRVLLLMDSVTRFAMALREIGLAAGEPPATRGYTPSVFAALPRLLERAGPRTEGSPGMITGLFSVLVEGDDHDEPVADAVRGILDGHVVLDRRIAEAGRYPAIDVLRSLSRTVPGCLSAEEAALARRARGILALAGEMADLVRLGAYRRGSDAAVDEALALAPRIEALLAQGKGEPLGSVTEGFTHLAAALEAGNGA
jgi:flagellum-specific ATP synthase